MASIKDVANAAGVSTATVSYVLNNTRKVSESVRERVLAAVRQLEYRPSQAARQLASGKSQLLAMLVSDIRNPFFPEIVTEFQEQAVAHGLDALVLNTNYDNHRIMVGVERLIALRVPGVAIMTSQIDLSVAKVLEEQGIATVYLDLGQPGPKTSNIRVDYEAGVLEALRYLYSLGHRKIGFLGGPINLHSARRRQEAFLAGATELPSIETYLIEGDLTVQGGYFAGSKLLSSFGPEAIFCANDLTAIGALHAAYDRKIPVPDGVSIVGFDDITFARYSQPALSTVAVPRAEIGSLAFQMLWRHIQNPSEFGIEQTVHPSLVIRESCRASCG